jgi:site-specific DNA-methyltransferase (adenine-specific)
MWLYGSGFPKSLNIGKQIDKMKGAKRKVIGMRNPHLDGGKRTNTSPAQFGFGEIERKGINKMDNGMVEVTAPATKEAKEWEGWGTALKPACEPIVVARKPLSEKNVALNVLKWGTGGINIDGCRIGYKSKEDYKGATFGNNSGLIKKDKTCYGDFSMFPLQKNIKANQQGRFPANIILDEEAGKMLDEQAGMVSQGGKRNKPVYFEANKFFKGTGTMKGSSKAMQDYPDKGGASRFFYCAKASKSERNLGCEEMEEKEKRYRATANGTGETSKNMERFTSIMKNNHPTVKPIKLMEYLIKLVSKEDALILDPFLGSGTTAIACLKLNRQFIGIEKEEEYIKIAKARINHYNKQRKLK